MKAFLVALLLTLTGCDLFIGSGSVEPEPDLRLRSGEEALAFYVASYTEPCVGMYLQQCMLVKEHPEDAWSFFYDSIDGFSHEEGYTYRLRVARARIANPPADASSYLYRLLQTVEKDEV